MTIVQRQHVHAEAGLQRCVPVELRQNHLCDGVTFQFYNDADTLPVRFVAKRRNAFNRLFLNDFRDSLDHPRLIDLIRNFGGDDRFTIFAKRFDMRARPHHNGSAPLVISRFDARFAKDQTAGREIRSRDVFHQFVNLDTRIIHIGQTGIHHFPQIVRRDISRHADGDTTGAVHQEIRKARREDLRFLGRFVVVIDEIDRLLVDIVEQAFRRRCQPRFRVTHGSRPVAIHRAEVTLPVDKWQAHGEGLRHANHRVVYRLIAMRVILTHDIADDSRRFSVGPVRVVTIFLHRIENSTMDRFQTVPRIRQRPAHDHAHRVIEIGSPHLLFDCNLGDFR